jgi:hypothetical protein
MQPPVGVLNKRSKEVKEVGKQESKEQGNEEQVLFPKRRSVSRCCGTAPSHVHCRPSGVPGDGAGDLIGNAVD